MKKEKFRFQRQKRNRLRLLLIAPALSLSLLFCSVMPAGFFSFTTRVYAAPLPQTPKIQLHNTADGVRLTWGNVSHANQYIIYRSTNGGAFTRIATVKKQNGWQYTDKKTKNSDGTLFQYYIEARSKKDVYTPSRSDTYTILRLCPVKKLKLKNIPTGVIVHGEWEKHDAADGYEIRVYAEHLKKYIIVKRISKNKLNIISLYPTKTYRVQVRTYAERNGKTYYSNWCNSKKIRARYLRRSSISA